MISKDLNTAYITGVAIGDGNLSNPNGRATRLRITCDNKYPGLQRRIALSLKKLLPENRVSPVRRKNCIDISCYSNKLESILGWKAKGGSKHTQNVRVPKWIFSDTKYIKNCLKGLFETDGSVYKDRKYTYVNFTTIIPNLSRDVETMIKMLEFQSTTQHVLLEIGKPKFVIRVCKQSARFIKEIGIRKD